MCNSNHLAAALTTKVLCLIASLVVFFLLCLSAVLYVSVGTSRLQEAQPDLHATSIQGTSIQLAKPPLRVATSLLFTLAVPGSVKLIPELGTFVLSSQENGTDTLLGLCSRQFQASKLDQKLLLTFTADIQESHLRLLDKRLHGDNGLWLRLAGKLKMDVKLKNFPGFPKSSRQLYISCDIGLMGRRESHTSCVTGQQPFT